MDELTVENVMATNRKDYKHPFVSRVLDSIAPDELEHIVAKPSKEDLKCILQSLYKKNDLGIYSYEQLFDIYKKNIEAGTIEYDKSKGYLGKGCSESEGLIEEPPKEQQKPNSFYNLIRNVGCQMSVGGGSPIDRAKEKAKCNSIWK